MGLFSFVMFFALRGTSNVWRRVSSRDEAVKQLVRARNFLTRDLMNGSARPNHFATSAVGPSLGAGRDGDALTVLTCEDGSSSWNITTTGAPVLVREVTYALFVPQNVQTLYGSAFPGVADSDGYEQACPYKWLVRRLDPVPVPVPPATESAIPSNWTTTFLTRPSSRTPTGTTQVVATLLGFRILTSGAFWQFEIKACAVDDARRRLPLGIAPLGQSEFTLVQRFSVPIHNN